VKIKIQETTQKIDYVNIDENYNHYRLKITEVIKYTILYINE